MQSAPATASHQRSKSARLNALLSGRRSSVQESHATNVQRPQTVHFDSRRDSASLSFNHCGSVSASVRNDLPTELPVANGRERRTEYIQTAASSAPVLPAINSAKSRKMSPRLKPVPPFVQLESLFKGGVFVSLDYSTESRQSGVVFCLNPILLVLHAYDV